MVQPEHNIHILVVEDEKKLAHSIRRHLERCGYVVEEAYDGVEAEEKINNNKFTLIILDLNLPRKSGLELLESLRSRSCSIPVIIVSARDKVPDRIHGLKLGADDYLVKPFDSGELVARVSALLRRSGDSGVSILQADDLEMDVVQRTVKRGEKSIDLSPKEFALLEFFLRNKNQILTRRRIAEQVWGYTFDTGTNIIDVYVSYLREAIDKEFPKKLINTVHGRGFILSEE